MQCHVCRAAGVLGGTLKNHGTVAAATRRHAGYRAAVSALLDTVACEDVSYADESRISQAVCAQAHLGHASKNVWQRLLLCCNVCVRIVDGESGNPLTAEQAWRPYMDFGCM
jgi:hypothetical protein